MISGWTVFAHKIIQALSDYDKKNQTDYAFYLTQKNGKPEENAVNVLASLMQKVDRQSQWEPIRHD